MNQNNFNRNLLKNVMVELEMYGSGYSKELNASFYQTDAAATQYLDIELHKAAVAAGGACSIHLDISAIRSMYEADNKSVGQFGLWILENNPDTKQTHLPVVIITKDTFALDISYFVIAHEIGHVVNKDMNGDSSNFFSQEVRQTELIADKYAASLVGKDAAYAALRFLRDKVEFLISCNNTWTPEHVSNAREVIQERLEAIAMF